MSTRTKLKDREGKRFGKLVIVETFNKMTNNGKTKVSFCYCNCDCGVKLVERRLQSVVRGETVSCGCVKLEKLKLGRLARIAHKNLYNCPQDELQKLIKDSVSFAEVLRKLNIEVTSSTSRASSLYIKKLGFDISHFSKWNPTVPKTRNFNGTSFKKRLIMSGLLDYRCYVCSMGPEWCGSPLTLQLDHIDGDRSNNEIKNLRILCPNCHTQTNTYAGKNNKTKVALNAQ